MYAFLFDKKSLILAAAGAVALGALAFGSGMVLGIRRNLPSVETSAAGASSTASTAGGGSTAASAGDAPAAADAGQPASSDGAGSEPTSTTPASGSGAALGDRPLPATAPGAGEAETVLWAARPPLPAPPAAGEADLRAATRASAEAVPPPAAPPAPATDSPPPFAAATALPPPAAADSLAARFSVQVGAYALLDNAEQRVAELSERGYSPYIVEIGGAGGRRLYTVRIGRFTSDAEARREAARFAAEGDGEAVVRRLATAS